MSLGRGHGHVARDTAAYEGRAWRVGRAGTAGTADEQGKAAHVRGCLPWRWTGRLGERAGDGAMALGVGLDDVHVCGGVRCDC